MKDVIAMVLAGGRVGELSVLTLRRPKSAVPYGGLYRIIDLAMSNLIQSGVEVVGLLSQYQPSSLIDHVGVGASWDLIGRHRGAFILPPHTGETDSDWYKGTADAIYQNLEFIAPHRPRDILVLSGDHIYHMDYGPLFEQHRSSGAAMTMVVKPIEAGASRFGIAEVDSDGWVVGYEEKPRSPRSNLSSLTIYLFNTEVLIRRVKENAKHGVTHHIYDEIIPAMIQEGERVGAYIFQDYWRYGRTIDEYYEAHVDLLGDPPAVDLEEWHIRTNSTVGQLGDYPPVKMVKGSRVSNSLIGPGCVIEGEVHNSVLSPGVWVGPGAKVRDSIFFHNGRVEPGAVCERIICDKKVVIGSRSHLGTGDDQTPNPDAPGGLSSGVTVVGKATQIPAELRVGRNVIIYPGLTPQDFLSPSIPSGTTVGTGR